MLPCKSLHTLFWRCDIIDFSSTTLQQDIQRRIWESSINLSSFTPGKQEYRESEFEKRLIKRFQAGESEALGPLFELYVEHIFAFAKHLLGSREDAEEVTSDAFVRALEKVSSFRGECPFRGWLFGITRNLCYDRLRQPKLLLMEPEAADRQSDRGRDARRMETSTAVRTALNSLSEDHRMALLLCDVEEWDALEVAEMLGKSLQATKSLLYRARRALRNQLSPAWGEGVET